jgi:hypothetical protein
MKIDVEIDLKSFNNIMNGFEKDLKYVTSRAINDTLIDAQSTMRTSIRDKFNIRRPQFVDKSVKISKFSKKNDLEGIVGIENIGGKETANILSKFEDGGTKTGKSGGLVAIPTEFVRPDSSRIIPSNKRPRNLRNAVKVMTKTGKEIILASIGRGKNKITEIAYWLKPSVKVDNRLHFVDQVTKTINERYNANFAKRFAEVRAKFGSN